MRTGFSIGARFVGLCVGFMQLLRQANQEIEFLSERIQELRMLQDRHKHIPAIVRELQDHIDKLESRVFEILNMRRAA